MKKKAASGKDVVATTVEALEAPPMCDGFHRLTEARALQGANVHGALGWVDEKLIREHGHRPGPRTRVFVCGLPGVYDSLCGPRGDPVVTGALARLGFGDGEVVKL